MVNRQIVKNQYICSSNNFSDYMNVKEKIYTGDFIRQTFNINGMVQFTD